MQPAARDLKRLAENWEGLARTDPLWAICTDPSKRNQQWNAAEFFASGQREIDTVLAYVKSLGIEPSRGKTALDFGCGVGRLSQALARHFDRCVGVDISPTMIHLANQYNDHAERCAFVVNESQQLSMFADRSFGFIYTNIVLQHVGPELARSYIAEFVRILDTGGVLVFQMPDRVKLAPIARLRKRLKLGTKLRGVLAVIGMAEKPHYMEMHSLSESEIGALLRRLPARLVDVKLTNATELGFNGQLEYLNTEPTSGPVSKQYCVLRT